MRQEVQAKGVSRRVVIVPTDDESIFEQVICIVREDADVVSADMVLRQAEAELLSEVEEPEETPPPLLRALPVVLALLLLALLGVLVWCFFYGA